MIPFGLGPKHCRLVPSGATLSLDTSVQVPTSCSLSDLCWLTALFGSRASASAVVTETLSTVPRFIASLPVFAPPHERFGVERTVKMVLTESAARSSSRTALGQLEHQHLGGYAGAATRARSAGEIGVRPHGRGAEPVPARGRRRKLDPLAGLEVVAFKVLECAAGPGGVAFAAEHDDHAAIFGHADAR